MARRPDGTSRTLSQLVYFDGKDRPCDCDGAGEADAVASRRLDKRTIEILYKKEGKPAGRVVRTISPDGRKMTLDMRIPAQKRTLMFEKEGGR